MSPSSSLLFCLKILPCLAQVTCALLLLAEHHTQSVPEAAALQEDDARWFFQQLIVGLDYCHKMGVVNRDIKLENTLLDGSPKPLVKITDFGYCKSDKESLPKSKVGTPGYTGETCKTVKAAAMIGQTSGQDHLLAVLEITNFGNCKSDKESLPKSKVGTLGFTGELELLMDPLLWSTTCPLAEIPVMYHD